LRAEIETRSVGLQPRSGERILIAEAAPQGSRVGTSVRTTLYSILREPLGADPWPCAPSLATSRPTARSLRKALSETRRPPPAIFAVGVQDRGRLCPAVDILQGHAPGQVGVDP
jgi:hypothetical protein